MAKKISGSRRQKRAVPRTAQITWKGAGDFFDRDDAQRFQTIIARPTRTSAEKVAEHLNFIAENYLIRYAHERAPTPDSKSAEWCDALVRDTNGLLASLAIPDTNYPAPAMKLETSIALTNVGIG
jgi:hypothetical protein